MLLPFNVERPARRVPVCTYTLIGLNVFVYLLTILIANVQLASDRPTFHQQIEALVQMKRYEQEQAAREADRAYEANNPDGNGNSYSGEQPETPSDNQSFSFGSTSFSLATPRTNTLPQIARGQMGDMPVRNSADAASTFGADGRASKGQGGEDGSGIYTPAAAPTQETLELARVLKDASTGKKVTKDELVQAMTFEWDAEHDKDLFVLEPHPTTLAWLGYWVGAPTVLGFFASMFLHGSLDHLLGNMLFLWVFGRALEDALGPIIYTLAYFVCGIAATLLFHIATMQFTPSLAMTPSLGASGAIAGLLGLFAPRFYRTPIKVFYTKWRTSYARISGSFIFYGLSAFVGAMIANFIGSAGYVLGSLIVLAGVVMYGEDELWGEWKVPAAWGIAGYFLWNDVFSLFLEAYLGTRGGVAHWAHIGGFCCGVAYAFMVGLTGEAKTEYITDEAEASLEMKFGGNAMESAQKLLKLKPNDPQAHRLMARALDARDKPEDVEPALDAWELAIEKFLQAGDRDGAAKSYLEAVSHHKGFIMIPRTQFLLGNHMARLGDHIGAAETLVKIPYTFPEAPEGELSLLRSAQLYAQHLHNPALARQLLATLLERYPHTEWKAQAESGLKNMDAQLQSAPIKG